jgi:hypothetical protein
MLAELLYRFLMRLFKNDNVMASMSFGAIIFAMGVAGAAQQPALGLGLGVFGFMLIMASAYHHFDGW